MFNHLTTKQASFRLASFIGKIHNPLKKGHNLLLLLSLLTGLLSGLAAVILKSSVHYMSHELKELFHPMQHGLYRVILPIIGIGLVVIFTVYFIRHDLSHGVSKILFSLSKRKGHLKLHNTFSSIFGGAFTVGFGGSVGLEAPIVITGASIGSNLARKSGLNYKYVFILIGCGAASAISAIFKAPIAGVIFTLEVLMVELSSFAAIPLFISSVTAAVVSYFFMGNDVQFAFNVSEVFDITQIPGYILLGLFTGIIAVYFTKTTLFIEKLFKKQKKRYLRYISGTLLLGVLLLSFPELYGEGYTTLRQLLTENHSFLFSEGILSFLPETGFYLIIALLLLIIVKVPAMAFTTSSGGVGGIFAPALFTGGLSGSFLGLLINFTGITHVPEKNFALAGMAGVMAAVLHAPMTSIFLIAEITGGYQLFIPLIIVSVIAYSFTRLFFKHSIYTFHLAEKGELLTHDKDSNVLTLINILDIIESDYKCLYTGQKLGDLVKAVTDSKRNIFPVINKDGTFAGSVFIQNTRNIIFNSKLYDKVSVDELMEKTETIELHKDNMKSVLHKFERSGQWNLPVLDSTGKLKGYVSKSSVFNSYRKTLKEVTNE
jgi:CIC family chloride channel protein